MIPATSHTLSTIIAVQNRYPPGKVERRIIAYYFEGLKYELYNLISLRLGRDSREAETCKDKLKRLLTAIKRTCYEMVNEELIDRDRLDGRTIAEIVGYIVTPDDIESSPLWNKLEPLLTFTFSRHKGVVPYIKNQVIEYIIKRTPLIETQYERLWQGAIEYIDRYKREKKEVNA